LERRTEPIQKITEIVMSLFLKYTPIKKDINNFTFKDWNEFDSNKFFASLKRKGLFEIINTFNNKRSREDFVDSVLDVGYGGDKWCAGLIEQIAKLEAGIKDDTVTSRAEHAINRGETYHSLKEQLSKEYPIERMKKSLIELLFAVEKTESTSEYGKNNTEEDYAEAFSAYVLNQSMPESIIFLFRKVNGLRVATNKQLIKEILKIAKSLK
jgi:hypothetical protein